MLVCINHSKAHSSQNHTESSFDFSVLKCVIFYYIHVSPEMTGLNCGTVRRCIYVIEYCLYRKIFFLGVS